MTGSVFLNAEEDFSRVLDKLYRASRIDGATYFYFNTPLNERPNLSLVLKSIPRHSHCQVLLDLGCGMGALEAGLHSERRNVETVGLDLNREYVHLAVLRRRLHDFDWASFVVGDIYNVPFKEDAFDVVVLHDTAPAININRVIKEDARVLKRNGAFVLDAPMKGFYDVIPVRRPDFIKYSKNGIVRALRTQGLVVERILLSGVPVIIRESFHLPLPLIRALSKAMRALPQPLQKVLSGFWFSAIFYAKMQ